MPSKNNISALEGDPSPLPPAMPKADVAATKTVAASNDKKVQGEKVQFNKLILKETAQGYDVLSATTGTKIPQLLAEGLALLQAKYGKP